MGCEIFALDCLAGLSPEIRDQQLLAHGRSYIQVKGKWTYFYRAEAVATAS
jgi:hypothetical protein